MRKLATERTMTTREVAESLGTSIKVVLENARKCLPNKRIENGKPTFWNKEEVTVLLEFIKDNNNRTDLDLYDRCKGSSTELTPALKLKKALELAQEAYEEELARIRSENTRITQERNSLQVLLDTSKEWASVKRMDALNPMRMFNWRKLKAKSDEMGIEPKKVFDENYGYVNAYHKSVWESCYELDETPWE